MIHRGEIVEAAVRQSGIAITEVAKRIGKSRRHMYNLFDDPNISIDTILKIGKVIHYDFGSDIPEIPSPTSNQLSDLENDYVTQLSNEYWKNKYFKLLEKYNSLLEVYKKD